MRILVTGGAGYIGAHVVRELLDRGHEAAVLDTDYSSVNVAALKSWGVSRCDFPMQHHLQLLLACRCFSKIDAVIHLAALTFPDESCHVPDFYYYHNVVGTCAVLQRMFEPPKATKRLVFASSCSVYGENGNWNQLHPTSPYGRTKLHVEQMIADHCPAYGLKAVALRLFNVCGAHKSYEIGERLDSNRLIPVCLRVALGLQDAVVIRGDGHQVRYFVHVEDVARAFCDALDLTADMAPAMIIDNVLHSVPRTVLEVVEACRRVTGHQIPCRFVDALDCDPVAPYAGRPDSRFRVRYQDLDVMIETAWNWAKKQCEDRNASERGSG